MNERCAWCKREIRWWHRLLRLFWAPWWCEMSFVWRCVCSPKCHEKLLIKLLEDEGVSMREQGNE